MIESHTEMWLSCVLAHRLEIACESGSRPLASGQLASGVGGCRTKAVRFLYVKSTAHLRGRPMGRPAEGLRRQSSASSPVGPWLTPPLVITHFRSTLKPLTSAGYAFLKAAGHSCLAPPGLLLANGRW